MSIFTFWKGKDEKEDEAREKLRNVIKLLSMLQEVYVPAYVSPDGTLDELLHQLSIDLQQIDSLPIEKLMKLANIVDFMHRTGLDK